MIYRLAETDQAIMAGCAIIENTGMLEQRRRELSRVMTDHAVLVRRQMVNEFTDADDIVVA